jgi:virulence factor Mce-like protein
MCAVGVASARREDGDGDLMQLYLRVRTHAVIRGQRTPPYKTAGLVLSLAMVAALVLAYCQFRGAFLHIERLTIFSGRAGLSMDPGAKVTYNGVEIGRVGKVEAFNVGGGPKAKITLDVDPKYLKLIPQNVDTTINATTVFGNKYIAFSSPKNPSPQRINSSDVIDATHVTTEFNTLLETVVSVAKKVDPIKLNQTLTATAEALDGLGDRFGQAIVDGNQILGDLNPQMPQIHRDNQQPGRPRRHLRQRRAGSVRRPAERGHHRAHTERTAGQHRSGVDGRGRARQHWRRGLRTRGPYFVRDSQDLSPRRSCSMSTVPNCFA